MKLLKKIVIEKNESAMRIIALRKCNNKLKLNEITILHVIPTDNRHFKHDNVQNVQLNTSSRSIKIVKLWEKHEKYILNDLMSESAVSMVVKSRITIYV